MTGALYGFILGITNVIVTAAIPSPYGWAVWWTVIAVQLAAAAIIMWRRTRLLMTSMAVAWAAAGSIFFAASSWSGYPYPDLMKRHWPVLVPALLVVPLVSFSEKWRSPDRWNEFSRFSEKASVVDLFLFRHIPDLRIRDDYTANR